MTPIFRAGLAAALVLGSATAVLARTNPTVGGAAMYPTKTIVENAVNSKDHTTLVAAVKAAGLVDTLSGPGPFTVFAPTDEAFAKLPAGTVDTLVKPENKAMLTGILTYHVVPGRISAHDIAAKAKANMGTATYATVQGGTLSFKKMGAGKNGGWVVMDAKGDTAKITIADVYQSNGVIHVIDTVLMP
ncbi:fasciclin domain-containing protein [soil metagenome]